MFIIHVMLHNNIILSLYCSGAIKKSFHCSLTHTHWDYLVKTSFGDSVELAVALAL